MEANVLIHFTQGDDQEKTKFLYPKGIHLSSPTAVYSDDHPRLHKYTYLHSMGMRSLWPTAGYSDDHPQLHHNTYFHSMGMRSLRPTAGYSDDHPRLQWNTSFHSMGILDAPWPLSAFQCCHFWQHSDTFFCPMDTDLP